MKKRLDDDGYALVTVLMIISIFSIISLAFANQAFTTTKQNKIVEEKAQAVALAEMGVEYFKAAVENAYIEAQPIVSQYIQEKLEQDYSLKCPDQEASCDFVVDEGKYLKKSTEQMAREIKSILLEKVLKYEENGHPLAKILISEDSSAKFKIVPNGADFIISTFEEENEQMVGKIHVAFVSHGIETDRAKDSFKLKADLTIDIADLKFGSGRPGEGGEGNEGGNGNENDGGNENGGDWDIKFPEISVSNPDNFNTITKPSKVPENCKQTSEIKNNGACGEILLPSNVNDYWGDRTNNMSNKKIYFENEDSVNLRSDLNNLNNVDIHAEGDLKLGQVLNSKNTTIESKGDLNLEQGASLTTNSEIRAGNNFKAGSPIIKDNSSIYVNNDMNSIGSYTRVEDNSQVYVGGKLDQNNTLYVEKNSKLYVGSDTKIVGAGMNLNENATMIVGGVLDLGNTFQIKSSGLYVNNNFEVVGSNHFIENNSILFVNGNFGRLNKKVDNFSARDNSKVSILGNAYIDNKTEVIENSSMYIDGNFNGANIDVKTNSNLCIRGDFQHAWGNINLASNGKIYVGGNFMGDNANKNKITFISDPDQLKSLCGVSSGSNGNGGNNNGGGLPQGTEPIFDWGNLQQDIDYQY